jgi:signal transduction histidine kinase/class 3 adenylate cyclase
LQRFPHQLAAQSFACNTKEFSVAAREPVDPMPAVVERKLVTVLVCEVDKPAGDSSGPDSVDDQRSLTDPLARVRVEIAHHGGLTVQVVGNTVVAAFGVPRTREDDAERAVRTAMAIRDALAGQGGPDREPALVWLRAAVATGEALFNLPELRTGTGPGVTGDPVLMATAVKEAAPPGSIVATLATTQATERAISYAPPRLLPTSWSREPMLVWDVLALRPHSRDAPAHPLGAALVARQEELEVLADHYAQVCADGRPQLLVLVGPAGIGKSRLVAEFGRMVTAGPIPPRWRAGRSHPYGPEGTSSALSEVVKAEAGILDTDPTVEAERKLAKAVSGVLQDPGTARWVTAQLNVFIGAGPDTGAGAEADVPAQLGDRSRPEEVFGAWRRFVQALASRGPLVLALEDLHWANDALLDLLTSIIDATITRQTDQSGSIPILIVATARSDLLVRRPAWATSRPERTTITLDPLPDADMASLLQALLVSHGLPATINPELIERVGGNPLFAEEYARMLRDRTLARPGSLRAALPIPSTVQRLIASRLDALPAGEKAILQDAAVLGRISWLAAIAAIGGHDKSELEVRLQELERKEFLLRVSRSRVAGEVEVEFRHVVVRDLVYSQLPRLARAERHRRAAGWIRQLAPGRVADRAELLAHHYMQTLALTRAAGGDDAELADLNEALQNTLIVAANEYRHVAEVEISFGDLPLVSCHQGELSQVFLNLLLNAAHAIADVPDKPGGRGQIRVETRRDADAAVISISDTGTGIPPEIRERIFEPFFTTKEVGRGTGQGLSLAYATVVERHGGTITVDSEVGRGSTFSIRIPFGPVPTAPVEAISTAD